MSFTAIVTTYTAKPQAAAQFEEGFAIAAANIRSRSLCLSARLGTVLGLCGRVSDQWRTFPRYEAQM